jgi:hypothetical protein
MKLIEVLGSWEAVSWCCAFGADDKLIPSPLLATISKVEFHKDSLDILHLIVQEGHMNYSGTTIIRDPLLRDKVMKNLNVFIGKTLSSAGELEL